ncbi:hypothetical protein [Natronococcus sp. A-GB7]|uniref:hypothetical protein n=1 Tax=Natronococcus sp. A-GB7 TaxID=3037649 RepID=UPI00241C9305|nr:hypothetical protein [Natronococcus sp. A-GB7]MDG5818595.1 hypothetical protein [Natronococcus sp. A-GB7]
MNRRTMLLGAGAALTATIAGCGSADGEDTDEPDDADELDDSLEDDRDDDADADDTPTDELSGEDDEDDEDDDPVEDRIPGFEDDAFAVDSDDVSIGAVTRDDETVTVRMEAHTLDQEALEDDMEDAGRAFVGAIDDVDEFTGAVSTVEWDVVYGGNELADFHIESEWLEAYDAGELSEDELLDRILETGSID